MSNRPALIAAPDLETAEERLRRADDATLALCALTNDPDVWREFVRRFEPLIRTQLGRTLAAGKKFLSSDSVDDALGEYWVALLKNDREWLRRYDSMGGATFASWLRALAWDVGKKHLRTLRRRAAGRPERDPDKDRGRGAAFVASERAIEPEPEQAKPFFKWE